MNKALPSGHLKFLVTLNNELISVNESTERLTSPPAPPLWSHSAPGANHKLTVCLRLPARPSSSSSSSSLCPYSLWASASQHTRTHTRAHRAAAVAGSSGDEAALKHLTYWKKEHHKYRVSGASLCLMVEFIFTFFMWLFSLWPSWNVCSVVVAVVFCPISLPSPSFYFQLSISPHAGTCWQVLRAKNLPGSVRETPRSITSANNKHQTRAERTDTASHSRIVAQGQQLGDGLLLRTSAAGPGPAPGPRLQQQQRRQRLAPGLWEPEPGTERARRRRRNGWERPIQNPGVSPHFGETRPGYWWDREVLVPVRVPIWRDISSDRHGGYRRDVHL